MLDKQGWGIWQAGSDDQDDFKVYCSPTNAAAHDTGEGAAAVVMDPFDPALQASLLADLNPPLCQVHTWRCQDGLVVALCASRCPRLCSGGPRIVIVY